jgi:hypothetical protein
MNVVAGEGAEAQPVGPLVLPGTYRVRVIAGADTVATSLVVRQDPRVRTSAAALKAQTMLSVGIWNAEARQFALQAAARVRRQQLAALPAGLADPAHAAAARMAAATDSIVNAMDDDLANILGTVESADREPTQQAREAFNESQARLAMLAKRWNAIETTDLPALNAMLRAQRIAPLAGVTVPPLRLPLP